MRTRAVPLVYSAPWCGPCIRLKAQLDREGVAYDEIDIDANPDVWPKLEQLGGGNRIIPTVELPDGSALVNPTLAAIMEHLASEDAPADADAAS